MLVPADGGWRFGHIFHLPVRIPVRRASLGGDGDGEANMENTCDCAAHNCSGGQVVSTAPCAP